MKRVGVDVGGTFTDAVLYDEEAGLVSSAKASSTHPHAERGVVAALQKLEGDIGDKSDIRYLVHGTTVATNAVLEDTGPRVGLITTDGFRDVLEIARLSRGVDEIYDLKGPQPPCLVRRRDRFEVPERVGPDGAVRLPLDEEAVRVAARALGRRGIETVAVSLLYSYLFDGHERRISEILSEELPTANFSLSVDVLPEHREYERTSTTVLNAYLVPVVSRYLADLATALEDWQAGTRLWIMQSSGGVASPARAGSLPVTLLLSGPSGGVVSGRLVAEQAGLRHSVTVDMGGTSFDACLLPDNTPTITTERPFLGMRVAVPSVDVMAIGAGGGSIGWVDKGGLFRVGPRSAGALPGPACYGRGGTEATVTDANLVLGVLGEDQELGGEVQLDVGASWRACELLGGKLGLSPLEAAWGIRRLVNTAMAGTVRAVSVGRGYDPRDFGLVAFGGAGPMHAVDIADELGIPKVVLPPVPGCHSAVGLIVTDISRDYVTSVLGRVGPELQSRIVNIASDQLAVAHVDLADEGVTESHREMSSSLDMRYVGQQSSVTVPVRHSQPGTWLQSVVEDFHGLHEHLYGFSVADEPVEVINYRLRATGRLGNLAETQAGSEPVSTRSATPSGSRRVFFGPRDADAIDTPVYWRRDLEPGAVFSGPAVVEQDDSTSIIPPRKLVRADSFGNLIVSGDQS